MKLLPSLIIFAEVVQQGSFTRAARKLDMSKSAVSQQISRLEKDLGVQLIKRNTRGMAVTSAGRQLLSRCELLKGQVDLALDELKSSEQLASGRLSVIFPHPLEQAVMIPAISQLCREYPGLEPNLTVTLEKRDLVKHDLDVAVFGGEPKDSDYRALKVATTCGYFCASPEYVQKHSMPQTVAELQSHAWIANEWQHNPIVVTDETGESADQEVQLREFARVNAVSAALALTAQHLGIALLPNLVCLPLIQQGKLVRLLPAHRGPQWPFYFIHPYKGEKPAHITRLHQLICHYFDSALAGR